MNILEVENVKAYTESKPLFLLKWMTEQKLKRFNENAKDKFVEEIMQDYKNEDKIEYTIILSSIIGREGQKENIQKVNNKEIIIEELKNITPETMLKISRYSIVAYQVLSKFRRLDEHELKSKIEELINFLTDKELDFDKYVTNKKKEIVNIEDDVYNSIVNDKYEEYEEKNSENNVVKAMIIYDTGIIIYVDVSKKDGILKVVDEESKNLLKKYISEYKVPQFNIISEILKSNKEIRPETFIEIVKGGGFYSNQIAQCYMFAEKYVITDPRANYRLAKFYMQDAVQRNPDKAVELFKKVADEGIINANIELAKYYAGINNFELAIENYEIAQSRGYNVENEIHKLKTLLYEHNTEVERLQPLKEIIEEYKEITKKDCYKITLEKDKTPTILDSKIGGTPYIPEGEDIPKDKNGEYMPLAIQINFKDIESSMYPSTGILEIFIDKSLSYPSEYKIRFYKEISDNYMTEFPTVDLSEFFYDGTSKIKFEKSVTYMPGSDFRAKDIIKGMTSKIIKDSELVKKLKQVIKIDYKNNLVAGSKNDEELISELIKEGLFNYIQNAPITLGGYGDFTQTDPRVYETEKKKLTECLVKIDELGENNFRIGDGGIISVLISEDNLKNEKFEDAILEWDCY